MSSIFVIIKKHNINCGHGDNEDLIGLAMTGMYNTEPSHPAFTSKEKADKYLLTLPKYKKAGLDVFEIEIKE